MEQPYTKRELDEKFADLNIQLFNEKRGFLPRIERQTIKHNGRLTKVERILIVFATVIAMTFLTSRGSDSVVEHLLTFLP